MASAHIANEKLAHALMRIAEGTNALMASALGLALPHLPSNFEGMFFSTAIRIFRLYLLGFVSPFNQQKVSLFEKGGSTAPKVCATSRGACFFWPAHFLSSWIFISWGGHCGKRKVLTIG